MPNRGRTLPAVLTAALAVLLWQLAAEVRYVAMINNVAVGPGSVLLVTPAGSLWSLQMVARTASGAALAGVLVTNLVLFGLVLLLVRSVLAQPIARRWVTFLASWMAVVLSAVVATVVVLPFFIAYLRLPADASEMISAQLFSTTSGGLYSGLVLGLLPALLVALMARPEQPAMVAGYASATYPVAPASDPGRSPYVTGPEQH